MHAHLTLAAALFASSLLVSCSNIDFTTAANDGGMDASVAEAEAGGMDAACGDTANDRENCGRCGHPCAGGACSKGLCQPIVLSSGEPIPRGVVAFTEPLGVSRVFWPDYGGNGGLRECRFGATLGCTAQTIVAGGQPSAIARNTSSLFWFRTSVAPAVLSLASSCVDCSMPSFVAMTPTAIVSGGMTAGDTLAFWTDDGFGANGHVYGCTSSGCASTLKAIVSNPSSYTEGIAFDEAASLVYYADGNVIKSCPAAVSPCTPTTILNVMGTRAPNTPAAIVVFGHRLYWTSPIDGAVATCDPTVDCLGTFKIAAQGLAAPLGLAVDASGIYVTEVDKNIDTDCLSDKGKVEMCPLAGCTGAPVTLADHQVCPIAVALTDKAIVWANRGHNVGADGSLVAIARP